MTQPHHAAASWTLRVAIDEGRADVLGSLIEAGHPAVRTDYDPAQEAASYNFDKRPPLALIDAMGAWLGALGAADATLGTQAPNADWRPGWRAWWQPLRLSQRFAVALPGSPPIADVLHTLYLEPGGGFGSGHHPSTRLAMEVLDATLADRPPGSLLDVGCGTGVLSIAAARLGWRTLGVDTDAHAVELARDQARRNQVQTLCTFRQGTLDESTPPHDLVIANMPAGCLVDLGPLLAVRSRSEVIVSGLDRDMRAKVLAALSPLALMDERTAGQWVALKMRPA